MYASLLLKIPIAIAGLILLLALALIYLRSKNVTRSEFWRFFKNAKFFSAWVLVFVFVLTLLFGIFNHLKAQHSVQAVVALNYSEASMAQNSNGTRYNMAEIICDEVVEKAIEMGAFENVTVKQLKDCLSVYPYVQGDVGNEADYHISTEFVVEYHASKHTQHLYAPNVILLITSAYKEYYVEKYTDNFSLTNQEDKPDYTSMEYMDIVSYFDKEATAILNYLYAMANKGSSFVSENKLTFNALAAKVHQFKQTQIDQNLQSLVLQKGIAKNKAGYIDRLSYQNKNVDFDRRKNAVSYDLCNQAIAMYAEEMTRVVLVPTWDESGKYYMGRTKVGIDELSVRATQFSDDVASNEKEIMDNNLVISKMLAADPTVSVNTEADALIATIDKALDDFTVQAIGLGRAYSNHRMNQCIAVSFSGVSLFSELKSIFLFAAFAYVALMLYAISKKMPRA